MVLKRLPRKFKKKIKSELYVYGTIQNAYLHIKYNSDYNYIMSYTMLKTILNYPNTSTVGQIIEWYRNNYQEHIGFINFVKYRNKY